MGFNPAKIGGNDQMTLNIGKLKLEYDGSIVVCGEMAGKLEVDCLSRDEINEFNAEIVRRWNLHEDRKLARELYDRKAIATRKTRERLTGEDQ